MPKPFPAEFRRDVINAARASDASMAEIARANPAYLGWNMEALTDEELERFDFLEAARSAWRLAGRP